MGPSYEEFFETEYWERLIKPGLQRMMDESIKRAGTHKPTDPLDAYTVNVREGSVQDLCRKLMDNLRAMRSG